MRSKKAVGSNWTASRWAKRIAQAAPTPDQPPAGADPAAGTPAPADPSQAPPAAPAEGAPAPAPPAAAEQPAPALSDEELAKLAEQEAKTEVITVTGSLIGRKEVDSPSPVSVVDHEKLESAGLTNVGDVLQKIPSQGNAINAQNNNGGDGSTRINLRSIGPQRTLVLLNGRRVVPSGLGANASVDISTIPLAMIERVEVLKDGASAIYGSDAIAGVVNIITRSNMNGTEANVYTSTTSHSDGTNYDLSFVTGHSSSRGNITFSGGYQNQKPVMAGDREYSNLKHAYDYNCSPEDQAAGNCATQAGSPSGPTGRINAAVKGHELTIPGCTVDAMHSFCTSDGHGGYRNYVDATPQSLGDNYNFQPLNYLLTPSQRVNLFSNGHYDITKNTHVFFEGQFNQRKSDQQLAEEPLSLAGAGPNGVVLSKDSIYNNLDQDIYDYRRRLVEFGPRTFKQEVFTTRMVTGLNGNIPEDVPVVSNWKWEASYNYGRNDSTQATHGDLIVSHLANALGPSFVDPKVGPQCGTPTNVIQGCVPLSVLTPNTVTQDMINYLVFTGTDSGFNEQHTALATASGKLVDLPNHGDISLAIGGDYRFERGGQQTDPLTATGDTTGNASAPTLGSYNVFEGFGELSIVPYSGGDFVKWTEINAAGRAYDYSTFGSGITGKITGLVRVEGGIALRGTYGNAFRAPNINELFSGQGDSFPSVEDPCDTKPPSKKGATVTLSPMVASQCMRDHPGGNVPAGSQFASSQQRSTVGGNPDLQPEKAQVGTAGIVYEPVRGLDFTLDYWHINIDNAITSVLATTILSQCYSGGVENFCNLVQRDPVTHSISHIIDTNVNVGAITTSGLDFSAAYQYRNSLGMWRHAVEGTYLFKYNQDTGTVDPDTGKEVITHGKGFYDLGVNPDLKFNVFTSWQHPSGVGAGFSVRFIDSFQECDGNDCNTPDNGRREVSKYINGDVYVNYALRTSQGTTAIAAGMNNVANVKPATIYAAGNLDSDESAYDFLGRQFYVRLSQQF